MLEDTSFWVNQPLGLTETFKAVVVTYEPLGFVVAVVTLFVNPTG